MSLIISVECFFINNAIHISLAELLFLSTASFSFLKFQLLSEKWGEREVALPSAYSQLEVEASDGILAVQEAA